MSEKEFKFNFANNVEEAEHEHSDSENEGEEEEYEIPLHRKLTKEEKEKLTQDAISSLPESLQPKVSQLVQLRDQYASIKNNYAKELFQLHLKYEKEFLPLLDQRKQYVKDGGIPSFWKTVLLRSELAEDIQERDIDSLNYLTNIRYETFDRSTESEQTADTAENEQKEKLDRNQGFTLFFEYSENPYFTNSVLTKTFYYGIDEDLEVVGKSEGCVVNWKSDENNLTVEVKEKKQRHKSGKGVRKVKRTVPCDSFYNFFNTIEEDEDDDEGATADLIEADIEMGLFIKDNIIPFAMDYYLGLQDKDFLDMCDAIEGLNLGESDSKEENPGAQFIDRGRENTECKQQ
jgi:nucleosome assembly protein 1-like 1